MAWRVSNAASVSAELNGIGILRPNWPANGDHKESLASAAILMTSKHSCLILHASLLMTDHG